MPKRQVRYGPYYLMKSAACIRAEDVAEPSLVDVEHQLARLLLQVLCVETKRGVTTRIRKLRALCVGVGCVVLVVTIGRFGAQSYGSGCYMFE